MSEEQSKNDCRIQIQAARNTIPEFRGLSDEAVVLGIQRPDYWKWLLFFQVLLEEVNGRARTSQAIELRTTPHIIEKIELEQTLAWMIERLDELQVIFHNIDKVLSDDLASAMLPGNHSKEPVTVIMTAHKLKLHYSSLLNLQRRFLTTQHRPICDGLFREFINAADSIAVQVESYAPSSLNSIRDAIEQQMSATKTGAKRKVALTLKLSFDEDKAIYREMDIVKQAIYQKSLQQAEQNSRTIPKAVQRAVWRRDGGRCVRCGSNSKLEYDHIIPFSRGGSNTERNIQLLCEACNRSKGAGF